MSLAPALSRPAGGSSCPFMRSATDWSCATRLPSRSAALPMRPLERETSRQAETSSSSSSTPCLVWAIKSLALWICYTLKTRPASVNPANTQQAPQHASATKTRTVMLSVVGGATIHKVGRWPGPASVRCDGAATLNASSARREKKSTPARGKASATGCLRISGASQRWLVFVIQVFVMKKTGWFVLIWGCAAIVRTTFCRKLRSKPKKAKSTLNGLMWASGVLQKYSDNWVTISSFLITALPWGKKLFFCYLFQISIDNIFQEN